MPNLIAGQSVRIPCDVRPGAFPGEHLITISTDAGIISGFVRSPFVTNIEERGYIEGKVIEVTGNAVTVHLPGSFFTIASGLASVSPSWAESHFREAQSA